MAASPLSYEQEDTPIYTIKTVVERTGIAPATLRAWERRYGILSPRRSGGGYRLYSERDIAILRWLKSQVEAGIPISRAVALLQYYHQAGQAPAARRNFLRPGLQFPQHLHNLLQKGVAHAPGKITCRQFPQRVPRLAQKFPRPLQGGGDQPRGAVLQFFVLPAQFQVMGDVLGGKLFNGDFLVEPHFPGQLVMALQQYSLILLHV
ncbi:MAG: MerR family transcriptional regulator [Desulfotomaculales bacterium]